MMRSLLLLLTIFATGTDAGNFLCTDKKCDGTVGCACPPGGTLESLYEHSGCSLRPFPRGKSTLCVIFSGAGCPLSHPEFMSYDHGFDEFKCCSSKVCLKELTGEDGKACSRRCPPPPPVAAMCQVNYNSTVTISGGTNMKVKFELCKGWPKDGNLTIVPPGGYSISEDATATMSASGVTGGLSVLVNDENIIISLNGDGILATESDHAVEIEITGVIIKAPVPHNYRNSSTDFAYVVSGQSGPVVTTTIEVTGVTETDLKADDEAQASLVGAVAASSAVGASLVSLTKIGDTLITRRRLESEELTLTFELKTGSAEAAKSLKQKLESTTFVSSVNALLAGTGIEVTGSPKAAIAGALAAVGNSTSTGNNSTGNSTSTGNNSTGNSTSTGNNSNDASTEKEEVIT